jgi:hypothetical protein
MVRHSSCFNIIPLRRLFNDLYHILLFPIVSLVSSFAMRFAALGIESSAAWATPASFTINNFPCNEDGSNCHDGPHYSALIYTDPSENPEAVLRNRREALRR